MITPLAPTFLKWYKINLNYRAEGHDYVQGCGGSSLLAAINYLRMAIDGHTIPLRPMRHKLVLSSRRAEELYCAKAVDVVWTYLIAVYRQTVILLVLLKLRHGD